MRSSLAVDVSNGHQEWNWINVQRVDAGNDDKRENEPGDEP